MRHKISLKTLNHQLGRLLALDIVLEQLLPKVLAPFGVVSPCTGIEFRSSGWITTGQEGSVRRKVNLDILARVRGPVDDAIIVQGSAVRPLNKLTYINGCAPNRVVYPVGKIDGEDQQQR